MARSKEKQRAHNTAYYSANREAVRAQQAEWFKQNGKAYMRDRREGRIGPYSPADGPDWQARNRTVFLEQKRRNTNRRRREIAIEALTHYSGGTPRCYCCGETQVLLLGLDHVNRDGKEHRKEMKMSHMSQWAKDHGWPPVFRVACHSCNLGSHLNGGVCPHQGG